MVFVVSHSSAVLDEVAHPARGPQPAGKAQRLRSAFERLLEVAQLGRIEPGWPPGALSPAQAAHPGLLKLVGPAADRLPVHTHLVRDRGLAEPLPQQSRRRQPPPLQGSKIAPHSCRISHALYLSKFSILVTIFYRTQ